MNTRIESSSISDRGLSEKRPQNEDSFLEIPERGIFAVADGVGGAQAGEVASQMAMEILGEAFMNMSAVQDAEEVMRAALESANSAIHQMSNELAQLSKMATTVVALHLNGNIATIGHVGDSRLYRFDSEGTLFRETDDHSMVAEEVRAGRMTEEQAENHPGKNIISRALGAEPVVELELKTTLLSSDSTFLICSDGVTRHIGDVEIAELLGSGDDLQTICSRIKETCYDRGAEDNLTAVLVRVTIESPEPSMAVDHVNAASDPLVRIVDEEEATVASVRPIQQEPESQESDED
ncbi:MAG: serine/threonine-protein phosphatase, partial [Pyrinomonadaceae bacterium]|nr:serine/threonine-protein phosphatase [Pyrinomonadaceae bacterium]